VLQKKQATREHWLNLHQKILTLQSVCHLIVYLPVDELKNLPQDQAFARMLLYWDAWTANINKRNSLHRSLQYSFDKNLGSIDDKIESIDARLGVCMLPTMRDHCITTWDGISFLEEVLNTVMVSIEGLEQCQANLHSNIMDKITQCSDRIDVMLSDVKKGFNEISAFLKLLNDEQTSLNLKLDTVSSSSVSGGLSSGSRYELDLMKNQLATLESFLNTKMPSSPMDHDAVHNDVLSQDPDETSRGPITHS
jgi:hypothetical protein